MFYVLDGAGILFLQNENDNSAKKFTLLQNIKAGEVFNEENVIYSSPSSKFSFISTEKTTLFQFTKEEFEKNEFIDNESRNSIVSDYLSKKRLFKAKMEYEILITCNTLGVIIVLLIIIYHFIGFPSLLFLAFFKKSKEKKMRNLKR